MGLPTQIFFSKQILKESEKGLQGLPLPIWEIELANFIG